MPLKYVTFFDRMELKCNPEVLYIFGDNFAGVHLGGQGKEVIGEPNALGIPVKRSYGMGEGDFLTDADLRTWKEIAAPKLSRGLHHLADGGIVVWPYNGIGSRIAELDKRAPLICQEIQDWLAEYQSFGTEVREPEKPLKQLRQM